MLTVWGRRNSSNVMPVMWALGELGLPHRREDAGGSFGKVGTEEYRAMNPNGRIPVLRDGDFTLWESNAIVRHLARTHGEGRLQPDSLTDLACADQWMDWHKTTVVPPMNALFWSTVRTEPPMRSAASIESARKDVESVFKLLDGHLASRDFMVGDRLSTADLPLGAFVHRYYNLPVDRPSFKAVEAWHARLRDREPFRTHVMIPFGSNPAEWYMHERGVV